MCAVLHGKPFTLKCVLGDDCLTFYCLSELSFSVLFSPSCFKLVVIGKKILTTNACFII